MNVSKILVGAASPIIQQWWGTGERALGVVW